MEQEPQNRAFKGSICIIDDEPDMVDTCCDILRAQGYDVHPFVNAELGLQAAITREFDLIIVDLMMPGVSGMQILRESKRVNPATQVVVFTGYPTIETAVDAMKVGAFDYMVKPFIANHLVALVDRAISVRRLESENASLKQKLTAAPVARAFIGISPAVRNVLSTIEKAAPLQTSVLITGEVGTGKELVARTIHLNSKRRDMPFVAINCSTLPAPQLESELFGSEKDAVSGSSARTIGLFEFARQGTLFLDEIGELTPALQNRILHALQNRSITRVGGTEPIAIDVRIIASTNRDMDKLVAEGQLHEALSFGLSGVRIRVPPLRDRPDDIPLLAQHFLDAFNVRHDTLIRMSSEIPAFLCGYSWPGNVRELEEAIQQAASESDDQRIKVSDLPEVIRQKQVRASSSFVLDRTFNIAKAETVRRFEREYVLSLLEGNKGNVSKSADRAGMHRSSFQRLIRKYRIRPEAIKGAPVGDHGLPDTLPGLG